MTTRNKFNYAPGQEGEETSNEAIEKEVNIEDHEPDEDDLEDELNDDPEDELLDDDF